MFAEECQTNLLPVLQHWFHLEDTTDNALSVLFLLLLHKMSTNQKLKKKSISLKFEGKTLFDIVSFSFNLSISILLKAFEKFLLSCIGCIDRGIVRWRHWSAGDGHPAGGEESNRLGFFDRRWKKGPLFAVSSASFSPSVAIRPQPNAASPIAGRCGL